MFDTKSILGLYRVLPKILASVDRLVYISGVNSGRYSIACADDTFAQASYMISLTDKKVNLINLKILIEKALLAVDKKYAKLLMLRFIDHFDVETILRLARLKRRTYFRRIKSACAEFESVFAVLCKNYSSAFQKICDDLWLSSIVKKVSHYENKFNENVDYSNEFKYDFDIRLSDIVVSDLKKMCCFCD